MPGKHSRQLLHISFMVRQARNVFRPNKVQNLFRLNYLSYNTQWKLNKFSTHNLVSILSLIFHKIISITVFCSFRTKIYKKKMQQLCCAFSLWILNIWKEEWFWKSGMFPRYRDYIHVSVNTNTISLKKCKRALPVVRRQILWCKHKGMT